MFSTISRRIMMAFVVFTLGLCAWFSVLVMASAYTVEDSFFNRELKAEARRLSDARDSSGAWPAPSKAWMQVFERAADLPADLRTALLAEPERREVEGEQGRHYHLWPLTTGQKFPILVAEVSSQLVVRPVRNELLSWLAAWATVTCAAALGLAAWLARRLSLPLQTLARQVQGVDLQLPIDESALSAPAQRPDEIGSLARTISALLGRVRQFAQREQQFTRDASHELRTPLAVMQMVLEPAATGAEPLSQRDVQSLYGQVMLMRDSAEMLLMLARESRDDASHVQSVEVLPLIQRWVLTHEAWLARRDLIVECELQERDALRWPMSTDAAQSVLSNVLNNAVQHGRQSSRICIGAEDGQLWVSNMRDEPASGQPSPGIGLGLHIVGRLLQARGGRHRMSYTATQARVLVEFAVR